MKRQKQRRLEKQNIKQNQTHTTINTMSHDDESCYSNTSSVSEYQHLFNKKQTFHSNGSSFSSASNHFPSQQLNYHQYNNVSRKDYLDDDLLLDVENARDSAASIAISV